jgi:L-ascorbate metabolism protein UlaG (beta-lactamase superfamily)
MKITWFGQACFLVESGGVTIVTDPYDSKIGLTLPKDLRADVVTISHQHMDHNNVSAVGGNPTVIMASGATEIKGITFTGIDSFHDNEGGAKRGKNIIFKFTVPEKTSGNTDVSGGKESIVTCAHLGDLGHVLDDNQLKQLGIGTIDILMIPVGGSYTISATEAVEIVHQIQPKIVIPMHYGVKGLGFPLDPVELFTEKMTGENINVLTKNILDANKSMLDEMAHKTEVIILTI